MQVWVKWCVCCKLAVRVWLRSVRTSWFLHKSPWKLLYSRRISVTLAPFSVTLAPLSVTLALLYLIGSLFRVPVSEDAARPEHASGPEGRRSRLHGASPPQWHCSHTGAGGKVENQSGSREREGHCGAVTWVWGYPFTPKSLGWLPLLRPGRLVKQNRRPNLPLIKTWPPEVEPDKTEYYDWEMIPKRNSDVDKTGITFKRRSEEYITAHKKYLNWWISEMFLMRSMIEKLQSLKLEKLNQ